MSTAAKRPRAELLPVAEELVRILAPSCIRIEIAGSLRRERPMVGDIELVAIPKMEIPKNGDLFGGENLGAVSRLWDQLDIVAGRSYTRHGEKYRQFLRDVPGGERVKVDLFTATPISWGWIFLVRTGPVDYSHMVASCLNSRGYSSRDGQIFRIGGNFVGTPSEADVFRLAGLDFKAPKERGQW